MNFVSHSWRIAVKNKLYIFSMCFCCVLFCFPILSVGSEFLCHDHHVSSMLLQWHWENNVIAPVSYTCNWEIWQICSANSVPNPCDVMCSSALNSLTLGIVLILWFSHSLHGDAIKWKHFPFYWPSVRGIHRSPVNSLIKASGAELWCFLWPML